MHTHRLLLAILLAIAGAGIAGTPARAASACHASAETGTAGGPITGTGSGGPYRPGDGPAQPARSSIAR
jgi:hypothetical protein